MGADDDWLTAFVSDAETAARREQALRAAGVEAAQAARQRAEVLSRANTVILIQARKRISEAVERTHGVLANARYPGLGRIELGMFSSKGWYIEQRAIVHGEWCQLWLLDTGSVAFAPFSYPGGSPGGASPFSPPECAEKLTPTEWTIQRGWDNPPDYVNMLLSEADTFKGWIDQIVSSFALSLVTVLARQGLRPY